MRSSFANPCALQFDFEAGADRLLYQAAFGNHCWFLDFRTDVQKTFAELVIRCFP